VPSISSKKYKSKALQQVTVKNNPRKHKQMKKNKLLKEIKVIREQMFCIN